MADRGPLDPAFISSVLMSKASDPCPYCASDNEAVRETYFDQSCAGCVARMRGVPSGEREHG